MNKILQSVQQLATRAGISYHKAFTAWYAINFHNLDEDEALIAAAMDGGNDNGIDLVFADPGTKTIYIIQGHCGDNHEKKTPKNKWSDVVAAIPFYENTKNLRDLGKIELADQIDLVKKENSDFQVAFGLVSFGKHNSSIEKAVAAVVLSPTFEEYQFFYLAQEKIESDYDGLLSSEMGIANDTLQFSGGIITSKGDFGNAWIGTVQASELIRLHKRYANSLFAGNVRLFLGSRKGGINEQIIKTASETPGLFWALNNGVSIIADSASLDKDVKDRLNLSRFSVVNGCQTTSALAEANPTEDCKILLRVIAAKEAVKNDVVRFNNSQNAIKIWTVRAVDVIQERLRKDLAKIGIEYAPKQSGSRRKVDEKKIIELDRMAQYLASQDTDFLLTAIDKKTELFDQPYNKIFYPKITDLRILFFWRLGNICERKRIEQLGSLGKNIPSAGLLAVSATYWIIFTAAKIIARYSDMASPHITIEKVNTDDFCSALDRMVEMAVEIYYLQGIDTYGDGKDFGTYKSALRSQKFLQLIEPKIDFKIAQLGTKKTGKPTPLQNTAKNIKV
jgi:hypothetical protein